MAKSDIETTDVPFLKNDFKNYPKTMGKPLDPADGPGKADAELGEEDPADDSGGPKEFEMQVRGTARQTNAESPDVRAFAGACRLVI